MYKKILAFIISIALILLIIEPTTAKGLGDNPPNSPTAPAIEGVAVSNNSHTAGSMQSVTISVTTKNVPNATTVSAQLTDSAGVTPVEGVDTTSSTISSNAATMSLSIPAGIGAGNYRIKVSITSLNITDITTVYAIIAGAQASITTVVPEPANHTSGNAQSVNVKINTNNVSNGTSVTVQLLDSGDGIVTNVNAVNGTINNNYASVSLSIPGNIGAGSYKIRTTVLTVSSDVSYTINSQSNNPTISRVRLSAYSQTQNTAGNINVTVDTANADNNAAVTVDLVQASDTSAVVAGVVQGTGNINGNTATIPLVIPASVGAGSYKVKVTVVGVTNPDTTQNYSVVIPELTITNISTTGAVLAQGSISGNVVISGTNFSSTASQNTVQIVNNSGVVVKTAEQPTSASSSSLTVPIPTDLVQGIYKVKVTVGAQNKTSTKTFTVTAPVPQITGVVTEGASLIEGSIAGTLTVNGANFGTNPADNILVLVKGSTETLCTISSSTAAQLKASIPVNLTEGTYTVKVSVGGANATYSGFAVTKPDLPAAPVNLSMTAASISSTTFGWSSVAKVTGYHVYRSVNNTDYTKLTGSTININNFTDSGLTAGTTYYYKVTAVNITGESVRSNALIVMTVPNAPQMVSEGTVTSNSIPISWSATTGASAYNVYRSTNGTDYSIVNGSGVVGTTYSDSGLTSGTTYYYKVTAANASGESGKSSAVSAITLTDAPLVPSTVATTFNSIDLSWTGVARANGYNVYRSTALAGPYSFLGTTTAGVLTYKNTGLVQGTTYYYKLTAKNSAGTESEYSAVLNAATKTEAGVPNAPTASVITKTSLQLSWASVDATTGYNVYRSADGTTYTKINSSGPVATTSYSDSGLLAGTTYYYKLTSINADGESQKSPELAAVTIPSEPTKPVAGTITSGSVAVSWTSVTGATGYNVYRSSAQASGYAKLNSTPLTGTIYTDSTVSASTKYYYKLTAINAGGESEKSLDLEITTGSPEIVLPPVPVQPTPPIQPTPPTQPATPTPAVEDDTEQDEETEDATVTPTPAAEEETEQSEEPVPVIVGSTVKVEFTSNSLEEAFAKAKEDSDGVKTVVKTIEAIEGAKEYALKLPAELFKETDLSQKIEISTPLGTMTVPDNMFSNITDTAASQIELSIAMADLSKLSSKVKNAIGNRPILELSVSVNGDAVAWNNPNAPVTISIPYKPTAEELKNPEHIVVSYIDGKGKISTVSNGRYNKATGKVTFTTTHFSQYAVNYVFKTFDDISKSSAKKSIEVLYSKGILAGTSKTSYSPKAKITRGAFVQFLVNTLGLAADADSNYADVKTTDTYYTALGIAKKLGITSSVGNNKFNPKDTITKEAAAVIIVKAMKVADMTLVKADQSSLKNYSDYSKIASATKNSLSILIKEGIYDGKNKTINPKGLLTREQVAVVMYRLYQKQ